jgi:hypothetical protein
MNIPYTGGCSCGSIRYECSAEPIAMLNCHCRQCQYASGGAFSSGYFVNRSSFKLLKGKPRYYELSADSGNKVRRGFCSSCGSQLFAEGDGNPDIVVIKPASLDDPSWFKPHLDIFTESAQPWDPMDPTLPKFPKMPEM